MIQFLMTEEYAENGNRKIGRRKEGTVRRKKGREKKQQSKKNAMAPTKRRQEEGAGVKSCQRKGDLLRFEDTDCFQCCYCVKMMSLMIPMVGWQEWRFNRTILLQNLLQLAGSVKSQNQSRGHVVILAIPSSSTLMICHVFVVIRLGWICKWMCNLIYSDGDVDHDQDDTSENVN